MRSRPVSVVVITAGSSPLLTALETTRGGSPSLRETLLILSLFAVVCIITLSEKEFEKFGEFGSYEDYTPEEDKVNTKGIYFVYGIVESLPNTLMYLIRSSHV
jgi:hypothetical protein